MKTPKATVLSCAAGCILAIVAAYAMPVKGEEKSEEWFTYWLADEGVLENLGLQRQERRFKTEAACAVAANKINRQDLVMVPPKHRKSGSPLVPSRYLRPGIPSITAFCQKGPLLEYLSDKPYFKSERE